MELIRLYFNTDGDRPWSVDNGPGTFERTFRSVAVDCPGQTVYRPLASNEDPRQVARAWVEFRSARLRSLPDGHARIAPRPWLWTLRTAALAMALVVVEAFVIAGAARGGRA